MRTYAIVTTIMSALAMLAPIQVSAQTHPMSEACQVLNRSLFSGMSYAVSLQNDLVSQRFIRPHFRIGEAIEVEAILSSTAEGSNTFVIEVEGSDGVRETVYQAPFGETVEHTYRRQFTEVNNSISFRLFANKSSSFGSMSGEIRARCVAASSVEVPTVTTQPADQTVTVGATATFTAAASGSPAPMAQWQVSANGGTSFTDILGATSPTYTTPATVASDNGNRYRAVFRNNEGQDTSSAATLVAVQAPTANAQHVTVPFNTPTVITLTGTDPNTPARPLLYRADNPSWGHFTGVTPSLTYNPHRHFRGTDSFSFQTYNGIAFSTPAEVSITVADPTLIITDVPSAGQRNVTYDFQFSTTGGSENYAYSITVGALPPGLILSPAGRITGTPTASGSFDATVTVEDIGLGAPAVTQSRTFTISVADPTLTASPPPGPLSGGTVGGAFSVALTTNGGTEPYSYHLVAGRLPSGMALSGDGRFSGTPTEAGDYSFTVTATDSSTPESGGPYALTVGYSGNIQAPTIILTPALIPQPQVGASYNANIGATEGTAPYTFSVSAGALPNGLSLDGATGRLSGIPSHGGSYNFTIAAIDSSTGTSAPFTSTRRYIGTVLAPAIAVTPSALPPATGGQFYSQALSADGGTAPYRYAVTGGALPAGVTLDADGVLSGFPRQGGSFPFTVTVTDSSTGAPNPGGAFAGSAAYTLSVNAPPTIEIAPEALPAGTVAETYSQELTAIGGTEPYTFAVVIGALPAGLSLESDGRLSGTPTAGGSFAFTVHASDGDGFIGSRFYELVIAAPTIAVAPATVPDATRNVAYSQTLTASGGTGPYSYAITSGALPAGLVLSSGGTLSGTPTARGNFDFTVTAMDSSTGTGPYVGSLAYSLTVDVPDITIAPETLAQGTTRVPYSQDLSGSGGTGPYTFAVTAGALPAGITLAPDGTLSGTTTQSGTVTFTATATDINGNTGERGYSLAFDAPAITITPAALSAGVGGLPFEQDLTATGGAAPYTFAVSTGSLPAGITLATDGTLSGTTSETGSFGFSATATDANGNTGDQIYTLVFDAPSIVLTPTTLPDGTGSAAYLQTLTASGGVGPFTFAASGTLPPGLALAADGTLSGTPTQSGSFDFTVTATDANSFTGSADYTVRIDAPALVLSPSALPPAVVGTPYVETITASGGSAPYGFALIAGALPSSVALAPDGTISGTPGESGSFDFTVEATDANGFAASRAFSLSVGGELPIAADTSAVVLAGSDVTIDLTAGATGGPFTDATILAQPDTRFGSASLDRRNGRILLRFVAEPNASGQTSLVYTLSNAFGTSAPATLTFRVEARPDPSLDREVIGLLNAQASTASRFAQNQITNFGRRLEQLHNEGDRRASSMDLRVSIAQGSRSSTSDLERQAYGEDGMTGPALGYAADRAAPPSVAAAQAQADNDRSADPVLYQPDLGPFAVWTGGFVNFGQRDNGGVDLNYTMIGVSGGIDYRFSDQFVGGFGVGYGRDRTDIGSEGTESRATAFSGALYGSYKPTENIFIDGLLGASTLDFQSLRFVTATGDYAAGQRSGSQIFAALTAGYEHRYDNWLISPYGRIEASRSWLDGFTEQGGGIFGLTYGDQQVDTLSGVLGLRANYHFDTEWGTVTPGIRAEYRHDFAGSSRATVGYSDIGSQPFTIETEPTIRDHVSLGLSLDWQVDSTTIGFGYDTSFGGSGNQDHRFGIRIGGNF